MFISACEDCYDNEHGEVASVNRVDEDDPICPACGGTMYYVYTTHELGIADGDYSHTSASLAINPCQTKAHKKLFPGIDVLPDGQIHFDSVKKQSDYCDKTGFDKVTQKIRKKGIRIG